MNHEERHGYRHYSLVDTHFHYIYPCTVENTEKTFRSIMEYFSLSRINMQGIACGSGHRGTDPMSNIRGLYLRDKINEDGADKAFIYGGLFHKFDGTDTADGYLSQVQEIYDMGFDGYKMLEGKPEFRKKLGHPLCDPIFDGVYAFMEETGMPLKMHLGDPYTAWGPKETISPYALARGWWYADGTYPSFDELHEEVYSILKKFPKLKICMAHFFFLGHDLDTLRRFFETWENTSVDLTPGASMFKGFTENYEKAQRFFEDYSDRIFFGSDTYNCVDGGTAETYDNQWCRITQVRSCLEKRPDETVDGGDKLGIFTPLNLSDRLLENIYFRNHERLHPHTRPTNRPMAKRYAEEMLEKLLDGRVAYEIAEENELEAENLRKIIAFYA